MPLTSAIGTLPAERLTVRIVRGVRPTRTARTIPLSAPTFQGQEWKYVKACLDSGWVSSAGPFVRDFEQTLAKVVGAPHAVATVNGTAALHIALRVAGVQPGDEVLLPDLTFVAPANAVRYCGAEPVLIDIHPRTWQLDVDKVERFVVEECERRKGVLHNRRTGRCVRAVMPVHLLGLACEMDRIIELAQHHHLAVVEDAAESLGVRYRTQHVGTFGRIGVFSFNGNKIVTSGGGGMIVTARRADADYARYLTTQAKDDASEHIHREVGYNYRLTNLQAALGLAQLEQLESFVGKKRAIAQAYAETLGSVDGVTLMLAPPETEATYWLYTVLLPKDTTLQKRKAIVATLNRRGIEARSLWHPIHGLPPFRTCRAYHITHATDLYVRGVSLPSGTGLSLDEVRYCAREFIRAAGLRGVRAS